MVGRRRLEDEEFSSSLSFLASDSEEVEDSLAAALFGGKTKPGSGGKREEHPVKGFHIKQPHLILSHKQWIRASRGTFEGGGSRLHSLFIIIFKKKNKIKKERVG